ncbi:galactosyltransferase-related protein [Dysgonomonas termitidis]|uniref:Galactosyltransferase-related protein n=1 Tax=Dysgonomonas termitidis TaxID=1516126 RepID=A0ABV9KZE4_9BACT
MKIDMKDTTFIIVVRLDSIDRLENIQAVTSQLCKYFETNIIIVEVTDYYNGILKSLLPGKVIYKFIEDKDNVFHRTFYFNQLTNEIDTPIMALWDTDVVIDKKAIVEATNYIRTNNADIAYPYNGIFLETSDILRKYYLKTKDIRVLYRNKNKLDLLYHQPMVGGAVIVNREKYIEAGMENERHYGWGNDDFDRYYRFAGLGYRIYRVNTPLFHLSHSRGDNSKFRSSLFSQISSAARFNFENSSMQEIKENLTIHS